MTDVQMWTLLATIWVAPHAAPKWGYGFGMLFVLLSLVSKFA